MKKIFNYSIHYSDCAIYNEPALPKGECHCGAVIARKRWWTYLYHLSCIRLVRLQSVLRSRLRMLFGLPPAVSSMVPYQNPRCRPFDNTEEPLCVHDLASLDKAILESLNGQVVRRGSFTRYIKDES